MSLDVTPDLTAQAEGGQVDPADFVACVRSSLPYAWSVISQVAGDLHGGADHDLGVAEHSVPPPSEAERGQLLRALASDAIRASLEQHFGIRLAFQNCHRVAAFRPEAVGGAVYRDFVSARSQILNQRPALRHC
jgi:NucS shadow ORF